MRKARAYHAFVTTGAAMSFPQLAAHLEIRIGITYSVAAIRLWFSDGAMPDSEVIRAIAQEFGVDYDWLRCKSDAGGPRLDLTH